MVEGSLRFIDVPGCPNYSVREDGTVWSTRPLGGRGGDPVPARQLKGRVGVKNGYMEVTLYPVPRQPKYILVHRLVLESFVGPCPEGMECRHLNGNRTDNRAANLQWGTRKENIADKYIHGTGLFGEQVAVSKLTAGKVIEIRDKYAHGRANQVELAKEYGVSQACVSGVLLNKTWKHLLEVS